MVCSDEGAFDGDEKGCGVFGVGVEKGAGDGWVGSDDGSWDGAEDGVLPEGDGMVLGAAFSGDGVGNEVKTGAGDGFEVGGLDGDDTGSAEENGAGDGVVGREDGSDDGILLGDGVGSKSHTSIRQSRPTFVLRVSKIEQNSSTKIAWSFPVKSIDMT